MIVYGSIEKFSLINYKVAYQLFST